MANTKARNDKIGKLLFITFLVFFPFGQLLRIETNILSIPFPLHPLEIILGMTLFYVLIQKPDSLIKKHVLLLLFTWLFTLFLSSSSYPFSEIVRGSFYILRFIFIYSLFLLVGGFSLLLSRKKVEQLILVSIFTAALFGWIQYLSFSDLRWLAVLYWDDHLNRLTGTFLDPGFTGIIMLFGFYLSLYMFVRYESFLYVIPSFVFLLTGFFTYSRATYLALLGGIFVILFVFKKIKFVLPITFAIVFALFLLPRSESEGVKLERTNSIYLRLNNYAETLSIISDKPVFGTGFNVLCSERIRKFEEKGFNSHSCSGSDSSILFFIATSGLVGFFVFLSFLKSIGSTFDHTSLAFKLLLLPSLVSLLIHSIFVNSFFYPWVFSLLAIFSGLSVKEYRRQ